MTEDVVNYLHPRDYNRPCTSYASASDLYKPPPERRAELMAMGYYAYLQTPEWQELRRVEIDAAEHRCRRCRRTDCHVTLELHHVSYKNLGNEQYGDLEVLCHDCHMAEHGTAVA